MLLFFFFFYRSFQADVFYGYVFFLSFLCVDHMYKSINPISIRYIFVFFFLKKNYHISNFLKKEKKMYCLINLSISFPIYSEYRCLACCSYILCIFFVCMSRVRYIHMRAFISRIACHVVYIYKSIIDSFHLSLPVLIVHIYIYIYIYVYVCIYILYILSTHYDSSYIYNRTSRTSTPLASC